jgi:hypothetical protein
MSNNIILTGPPRSGTTLTCFLLNKIPDTIALNEPMNLKMFPNKEHGLESTIQFFKEMRNTLLENGTAVARQVDGRIPDNIFPIKSASDNDLRTNIATKGSVRFEKPLSSNFNLVIKHNAHFSFLLDLLIPHFSCYAIVRNPLATIASWNTINAPVSRGNLNVLKTLDSKLYNQIESIPDLIDRQVFLLDKLFSCYEHLNKSNIIRYEDLINSNGKCLSIVSSNAYLIEHDLVNKNQNSIYDRSLMKDIKMRLLASEGAYWKFYDKKEVAELYNTDNY